MNSKFETKITFKIYITETKTSGPIRREQIVKSKKAGTFLITFREENGLWIYEPDTGTQIRAHISYSTKKTNNPRIRCETKYVKISVTPPTASGDYNYPNIKFKSTRTHVQVTAKITTSSGYFGHYTEFSKRLVRENYHLY